VPLPCTVCRKNGERWNVRSFGLEVNNALASSVTSVNSRAMQPVLMRRLYRHPGGSHLHSDMLDAVCVSFRPLGLQRWQRQRVSALVLGWTRNGRHAGY